MDSSDGSGKKFKTKKAQATSQNGQIDYGVFMLPKCISLIEFIFYFTSCKNYFVHKGLIVLVCVILQPIFPQLQEFGKTNGLGYHRFRTLIEFFIIWIDLELEKIRRASFYYAWNMVELCVCLKFMLYSSDLSSKRSSFITILAYSIIFMSYLQSQISLNMP